MRHLPSIALTALAVLLLSACDGGGASGQGPEPTPPPPSAGVVLQPAPQITRSEQFAMERDISGARDVTGAQSTLYRLNRE